MVIDLQVTPHKSIAMNSRKVYPDNNPSTYYHEQLAIMKTNLLNPVEVKFDETNEKNEIANGKRKRLTTISSSSSTGSSAAFKKKIPDGGYGWVVVFASLMVSLIADGVSFSFGLIYTQLLNYFEEGPTKTAWVSLKQIDL